MEKGDQYLEDDKVLRTPLSIENTRLCREAAEDIARCALVEDDRRLHELLTNPFYVYYSDVVNEMVEEVHHRSCVCI